MEKQISSTIQSIRDTLGGTFAKPNLDKNNLFIEALKDNQTAIDYLQIKRGLSPETISHFKLGYDAEKNAISIPVYKRGELINIRYRFIDEDKKPKYTQEKGCEVWIYNEDGISKGQEKKGVLIVEGEFDLMSTWQAGIKNVISPASGKDSYGMWIELIDTIPKAYIAYDNDKPGKDAAKKLADRLGTEKSFEVCYPEGIKDANEYFKKNTMEEFRKIIAKAKPFISYKFQGVGDVISMLREKKEDILKLKCVPFIEFEQDWLVMLSGVSNVGKSSVAMNIADELVNKDIPCLVLPFERGIKTVGKRYLQVRYKKDQNQFECFTDKEWDDLVVDAANVPIYFSMPGREDIKDTIAKAVRIFGVKVCIIDHLDYLVRKSGENHNLETSNTLQEFKTLAQEHNVIFIVVHHIRKQEGFGSTVKKPRMEDLKGSSSVYQDPEAVIMLSTPEKGQLEVDIVKNKGTMGSRIYQFNLATGVIGDDITGVVEQEKDDNGKSAAQRDFENF